MKNMQKQRNERIELRVPNENVKIKPKNKRERIEDNSLLDS